MADSRVTETMELRGSVGDWRALRFNSDYKADWRAQGGAGAVEELAGVVRIGGMPAAPAR